MAGIIVVAVITAWFASIVYCMNEWAEPYGKLRWLFSAAAIFIVGLGLFINAAIVAEEKGPCVQSEIQMHYNAATKTMMPAKVCILRGEWVK